MLLASALNPFLFCVLVLLCVDDQVFGIYWQSD